MKQRTLWLIVAALAAVVLTAGSLVAIGGRDAVAEPAVEAAPIDRSIWMESPLAEELSACAAERGVSLYAASPDALEAGRIFAKGKNKPDPCDTCSETLGSCERISCNPCCYSCEGLPYVVCVDY